MPSFDVLLRIDLGCPTCNLDPNVTEKWILSGSLRTSPSRPPAHPSSFVQNTQIHQVGVLRGSLDDQLVWEIWEVSWDFHMKTETKTVKDCFSSAFLLLHLLITMLLFFCLAQDLIACNWACRKDTLHLSHYPGSLQDIWMDSICIFLTDVPGLALKDFQLRMSWSNPQVHEPSPWAVKSVYSIAAGNWPPSRLVLSL